MQQPPTPGPTTGGKGLYELLVESVLDYAIFALDPRGYIRTWNRGAERIKGYTAEEIIGRHFSVFYPQEDLDAGKTEMELRVAAAEGRFEDQGWRLRKDGTRFWANVVITALRDENGELVGFAKVTRDLTDRRAAEEQLQQSEERFRTLVQSVKDYAIFMLDPQGYVATWNEGAERIKGYRAEEIIGRHLSTFIVEEEVAAGKPAQELATALQAGRFEEEGWRLRKDGTRFWANVVLTPLWGRQGEHLGFVKVTRDLTERRRAQERALEDARKVAAAESASQTKTEFLTTLSHELRTPLNAVAGYAELIELGIAGPVTGRQREYVDRIRSSQQHLLGIINDMLNYSRIEAGQLQYDLETISPHEVADRAMHMVLPQATAKSIALSHGPCDESVSAYADAARVEQIVLNLLSNATKFTPPHGQISVRCLARGDGTTLSVSDSGPGIPEDKRAAIFEPFVQLGRSLTSLQEGTGLGLAISRDLARAMGGDVHVEETPGGGATFVLTLPAHAPVTGTAGGVGGGGGGEVGATA